MIINIKDHQIKELVNRLTIIARNNTESGSLRQLMSVEIVNTLKGLEESDIDKGEPLNKEEKLLIMFKKVHGEMTGSCYLKIAYKTDGEFNSIDDAIGVIVMKDGNECWRVSQSDLLFEIITSQDNDYG